MTFDEARTASLLGLKVRRKAWRTIKYFSHIKPSNDYRYLYMGKTDSDEQYYNLSMESIQATDWEIYKEDPNHEY